MTGNKLNTAVGLIVLLLLTISSYAGPGDVTVSGTVTARAFVTEKTPTNADTQLNYSNSTSNLSGIIYEVPTGQRYVIESVSVWSLATTCAFYLVPDIILTAGGELSEFRLPKPDRSYSSSSDYYVHHGAWPIKLYADSGDTIQIGAIRTETGCETVIHFSLSGYLEYQEQHRLP